MSKADTNMWLRPAPVIVACLLLSFNVPSLFLLHFRRSMRVVCRSFPCIVSNGRRAYFRSRPGLLGGLLAGRGLASARDSRQVVIYRKHDHVLTGSRGGVITGFWRGASWILCTAVLYHMSKHAIAENSHSVGQYGTVCDDQSWQQLASFLNESRLTRHTNWQSPGAFGAGGRWRRARPEWLVFHVHEVCHRRHRCPYGNTQLAAQVLVIVY